MKAWLGEEELLPVLAPQAQQRNEVMGPSTYDLLPIAQLAKGEGCERNELNLE